MYVMYKTFLAGCEALSGVRRERMGLLPHTKVGFTLEWDVAYLRKVDTAEARQAQRRQPQGTACPSCAGINPAGPGSPGPPESPPAYPLRARPYRSPEAPQPLKEEYLLTGPPQERADLIRRLHLVP